MNKKELFKKVEGRLYNYKNLELQINNLELDIEQEKSRVRFRTRLHKYHSCITCSLANSLS